MEDRDIGTARLFFAGTINSLQRMRTLDERPAIPISIANI